MRPPPSPALIKAFIFSCLPLRADSVLPVQRESQTNPNAEKTRGVTFSTFLSCGSYNIIKNPLNFNGPYKICALVKASTDNYF